MGIEPHPCFPFYTVSKSIQSIVQNGPWLAGRGMKMSTSNEIANICNIRFNEKQVFSDWVVFDIFLEITTEAYM